MLRILPTRDLKGINTNLDTTDRSQSFFNSVENLVPWPSGAFSSMVWTGATGEDGRDSEIVRSDCKAKIDTALTSESSTKAHLVLISLTAGNDHDLLCVWSKQHSKPLMLFPVSKAWEGELLANSSYLCPGPLTGAAPHTVTLLSSDLDPSLLCYASRISDFIVIGNGTEANLEYTPATQGVAAFAPVSPTFGDFAQVAFPPCKHFVMGQNREIYGTGNVTNKLRVWATNKPGAQFPVFKGLENLTTTFTDITLVGATKINALSMWNNYITAHTDKGAVALFGVNSASDTSGFKTDQRPSACPAGASNPDCVEDSQGQGAYFLGSDNQLYYDQSIRGGPFNKYGDTRTDSPLAQYGDWAQHMAPYTEGDFRSVIYDRERGLVYIFAKLDATDWGTAMWCYNEQTKGVTGPVTGVCPDLVTSIILAPNRITTLLAMTMNGVIHVSCGPQESTRPRTAATSSIAWNTSDMGIQTDDDRRTMARKETELVNSKFRATEISDTSIRTVFGDPEESVSSAFESLRDNTVWSMIDTGYIDLGDSDREKALREVRVALEQGFDYGVVGVVMDDEGHYRYKETFPGNGRTQPVLRFNIRGRKHRIILFIAHDIYTPLTITEITYGLLASRSVAKG